MLGVPSLFFLFFAIWADSVSFGVEVSNAIKDEPTEAEEPVAEEPEAEDPEAEEQPSIEHEADESPWAEAFEVSDDVSCEVPEVDLGGIRMSL